MRSTPALAACVRIAAVASAILATSSSRANAELRVLHAFKGTGNGDYPSVALTFDRAGNLYGGTDSGGGGKCLIGCGVVFELVREGNGSWNERVIHHFDGQDGISRLTFDRSGNLFGSAYLGGRNQCGFVFELSPLGNGQWSERHIYDFLCSDGSGPAGGLLIDKADDIFGTTLAGGPNDAGAVFELKPNAHGGWYEVPLHYFKGSDGNEPTGHLAADAAGDLFGTTTIGGPPGCYGTGCGTVFELTPSRSGWTFTMIHAFKGKDGVYPAAGPIVDRWGDIIGTTVYGGDTSDGVIFRLDAASGWKEDVLYSFPGGANGGNPNDGVIEDADGNLYGTTQVKGKFDDGVAFELEQAPLGVWTEIVLHTFTGGRDGSLLYAGLTRGMDGVLYGVARAGGAYGYGVAFAISP